MATDAHRAATFHQASWNEPLLLEQTSPGRARLRRRRRPSRSIAAAVGDGLAAIPAGAAPVEPAGAARSSSQPQVLRHFLRLSQETLGEAVDIHLGLGTCTMKYSPKVNEALIRSPQGRATCTRGRTTRRSQGMLEAMHRFERIICEISGMDRASLPARRRHRRRSTRTPA